MARGGRWGNPSITNTASSVDTNGMQSTHRVLAVLPRRQARQGAALEPDHPRWVGVLRKCTHHTQSRYKRWVALHARLAGSGVHAVQ